MRKRTFRHARPAKIQISLHIHAVWSESSLGTFWTAQDAKVLHAGNEDADQNMMMCRLICVFFGLTCQKVHFLILRLICWALLTLKAPITTAADDKFFYLFFFIFQRKQVLTFHVNHLLEISKRVFSEKKKKFRMSCATNFAWSFKG